MPERDLSFEALAEETGSTISSERGALNKALKEIREASPDLDDADLATVIRIKAGQYRKTFPTMALTPTALAKHWMRVEVEQPKPTYREEPSRRAGSCPDCDGHKMVLVAYRPARQTIWMEQKKIQPNPNEKGYEEWAPCPSCNLEASADFWRHDGSRFRVMDPGSVRERMAR